MGRIYTLANQKEGRKDHYRDQPGAYLAYYGQRVLLIDLTPGECYLLPEN